MTINRETVPYFHGVRKNENYLSFLWQWWFIDVASVILVSAIPIRVIISAKPAHNAFC